MPITFHVVVPFDWTADGELLPLEAQELATPQSACRRAEVLGRQFAGAAAFTRIVDPAGGEIGDIAMIVQVGDVDLETLTNIRVPFVRRDGQIFLQ